jgi:hypothetical protein
MVMTIEALHTKEGDGEPVAFTAEDLRLLKACVGFLSLAGTDPRVRGRLDELWWRLERAHQAHASRRRARRALACATRMPSTTPPTCSPGPVTTGQLRQLARGAESWVT